MKDRLGTGPPADRDEQPVEVGLEEPRRRVSGVSRWKDAHHREDVRAFHECLHAVKQHRLPRHPPKLFRLGTASARARSSGDDDDADVARAHSKRRPNSSAIVRTPTTSISRNPRFGTPRSATYARVIPIFAASAR